MIPGWISDQVILFAQLSNMIMEDHKSHTHPKKFLCCNFELLVQQNAFANSVTNVFFKLFYLFKHCKSNLLFNNYILNKDYL